MINKRCIYILIIKKLTFINNHFIFNITYYIFYIYNTVIYLYIKISLYYFSRYFSNKLKNFKAVINSIFYYL